MLLTAVNMYFLSPTRFFLLFISLTHAAFVGQWDSVPPTPELPPWNYAAWAPINGIELWYAEFGLPLNTSPNPPVIFLHGGDISSRWWGLQIAYTSTLPYTTIAVDSRGLGRSTFNPNATLTYDLMTTDLLALMDYLSIPKASLIGWSDGAIIALDFAMNHSSRLDRALAFGANYNPANLNITGIETSPTVAAVEPRFEPEYNALNPSPNWTQISDALSAMQAALPQWGPQSFARIATGYAPDGEGAWPLLWIADGDHEEAILAPVPAQMQSWVSGW